MSLADRLKKASIIKEADTFDKSKVINESLEEFSTDVPMLNLALSGKINGGLSSGLTVIAGPSGHFKSLMALKVISCYMEQKPEAVLLFYDSEFGTPSSYLTQFGIDLQRVVHIPVKNVEELKFDLMKQLEEITRKDDVIIFIDSIGNLASKKEVEDAKDEKSVADMSRAKAIKSLFRIATPYLKLSNIPMIAINHVYAAMDKYSPDVMSGGAGIRYSANLIWFMGKRQQKVGDAVTGYEFVININKSRFTKDKVKIPISVTFEKGIERYSGLYDLAIAIGAITKVTTQSHCIVDLETGEVGERKYKRSELAGPEMWEPILKDPLFVSKVEALFSMNSTFDIEAADEGVPVEEMLLGTDTDEEDE